MRAERVSVEGDFSDRRNDIEWKVQADVVFRSNGDPTVDFLWAEAIQEKNGKKEVERVRGEVFKRRLSKTQLADATFDAIEKAEDARGGDALFVEDEVEDDYADEDTEDD